MNHQTKARLALLASILLAVGWVVWALLSPRPPLAKADLERMAEVLEEHKSEHGKYPANLEGIILEAEIMRVEYSTTNGGFTLSSRADPKIRIERNGEAKSPNDPSGDNKEPSSP